MATSSPVTHPALCLTYSGNCLIDSHIEEPAAANGFYVLELIGPVAVQFGVHEGEPWYRWVWMWESTREADLALAEVSPDVEHCLDTAVAAIREHVAKADSASASPDRVERLDIGALLAPIGWPMFATPHTKIQAAASLATYQRLLRERSSIPPK